MRQQYARRTVGEHLPADLFTVRHPQRSKRDAQLNDRYVGRTRDARHQRQFEVHAPAERASRRQ
jgi:hypothetical protein